VRFEVRHEPLHAPCVPHRLPQIVEYRILKDNEARRFDREIWQR
jgi:hypothetical protein